MEWSKVIRENRKSINVTQEDLALATGVSLSFIKLIEQGKANPSISVLENIIDALGYEIQIVQKQPKLADK